MPKNFRFWADQHLKEKDKPYSEENDGRV